jgi:hypothetical protein
VFDNRGACSQCSVMFLNPAQFNAHSTANPNIDMQVATPMRRGR